MSLLDEFDSVQTEKKSSPILDDFDSTPAKKEAPKPKTIKTDLELHPVKAELTFAPEIAAGAAHLASGIGNSIIGGWRGLTELALGGTLEDATKAVHGEDANAIARPYQPQDETAQKTSQALNSPRNPMNWVGAAGNWAGEKTTDMATKAGASPEVAAGAGAAVNTGINAVPLVLIKGGKTDVKIPVLNQASELSRIPAKAGSEAVPTQIPQGVKLPANVDIPPAMRRAANTPPPAQAAAEAPKAPVFAEEAAPAPEGKSLPIDEQMRRAAVLRRVGVSEARDSAIKGDAKAASTDFQTAKLDNKSGYFMRGTLDAERQAITDHAEKIVRDTGGTLGTDSQALEARGHAILAPLESFRQWFTDKTTGLYKEADARAKGQPVELGSFHDILKTDSKFANTDTIELRKGLQARMKELGLIDKEGKALPATVEQAEKLRQYVNEEWSPKSNGRIRELKNALDDDVTKAAGEDLYKQARALHAMKESIFSDPKGLSSILDSEGINRKVPIEKIADSISSLPNAQFAHIVKTLKTVPPELKPQADAALSEIKAHFANRLMETGNKQAGQWNAKGTSSYLNKNSAKLAQIFDESEMAKFKDLNEAGHILRTDQSYPGAAVQEHNLLQRGAMASIRAGSAAVGGALGGGVGAAVGDFVGGGAAQRFSDASALKKTQKRVVKLSEFPK